MVTRLRDDAGFSLAELLVVSTLMVVVLAAAWMAFGAVSANLSAVSANTTLSNDSDQAIDVVSRELRQAQEVKDGEGVFVSAAGDDVTFYSQVNKGDVPERIHYYRQGNALFKTVDEPQPGVYPYEYVTGAPQTVIDSLAATTTPVFSYYTNDVPPSQIATPDATNLNRLSMVGITITTQETVPGSVPVTHTTAAKVKIRSMFGSLN